MSPTQLVEDVATVSCVECERALLCRVCGGVNDPNQGDQHLEQGGQRQDPRGGNRRLRRPS